MVLPERETYSEFQVNEVMPDALRGVSSFRVLRGKGLRRGPWRGVGLSVEICPVSAPCPMPKQVYQTPYLASKGETPLRGGGLAGRLSITVHISEQTPNPYAISILALRVSFAKRRVPSHGFAGMRGIRGAKTVEAGSVDGVEIVNVTSTWICLQTPRD